MKRMESAKNVIIALHALIRLEIVLYAPLDISYLLMAPVKVIAKKVK
jgi:hypothetical protein